MRIRAIVRIGFVRRLALSRAFRPAPVPPTRSPSTRHRHLRPPAQRDQRMAGRRPDRVRGQQVHRDVRCDDRSRLRPPGLGPPRHRRRAARRRRRARVCHFRGHAAKSPSSPKTPRALSPAGFAVNGPGGIRTPDRKLRRLLLCPLSYGPAPRIARRPAGHPAVTRRESEPRCACRSWRGSRHAGRPRAPRCGRRGRAGPSRGRDRPRRCRCR
jgi:hypothetical protein